MLLQVGRRSENEVLVSAGLLLVLTTACRGEGQKEGTTLGVLGDLIRTKRRRILLVLVVRLLALFECCNQQGCHGGFFKVNDGVALFVASYQNGHGTIQYRAAVFAQALQLGIQTAMAQGQLTKILDHTISHCVIVLCLLVWCCCQCLFVGAKTRELVSIFYALVDRNKFKRTCFGWMIV